MTDRTRQGLDVMQVALLVGVLGDALLRATPWGLNLLLWMLVLIAASVAVLARWRRALLGSDGRWLVLPLLCFAAAFAWRDSLTLLSLDVIAILMAAALALLHTRTARIHLASIKEYLSAIGLSAFHTAFGFPTVVLSDVNWQELPRARWSRYASGIVRGLLIALPLVVIFGGLFMAADAVFEGFITNALNIDMENLFGHVGLMILFSWLTGGFLRGLLGSRDRVIADSNDPQLLLLNLKENGDARASEPSEELPVVKRPSLGIVEIGVALGMLDLLFLFFVTVQIRYFFGGAQLVQTTTGLTYAEYARRGFFELVWVAALVLPLLLAAHWLLRKENPVHERIFRVLAGAQIALLFIIMASALGRMRLYQREYGLTELRLYTTVFMMWLAVVFVWFAWTVLRGARERFVCGALTTFFIFVSLLHVLNPDAAIVRANLQHAIDGRGFDAFYAASLSADAVPVLAEGMSVITNGQRCAVATNMLARWPPEQSADWRTWNMSRAEARRIVRENAEGWRASACSQGAIPLLVPTEAVVPNGSQRQE